MLRITVEDNVDLIVLRAEGKVKGPWTGELAKCWRSTAGTAPGRRLRLDMKGVTSVDQNARSLLLEMVEEGVELQAEGPMMTSLVNQIVSQARKKRQECINA